MNQTYTVFSEHGFQNTDYDGWRGLTLEQTIDRAANELGMKLIAWAPEGVLGYEGKKNPPTLRAESIAAGRLIEKVDGKYVARGMEEDKPALTLGAILRQALERQPTIKPAPAPDLEPKREPLDWNKSTPFDPFKGYEVRSVNEWRTPHTHSHPLQKMAEGKEGFGSAALLKVR